MYFVLCAKKKHADSIRGAGAVITALPYFAIMQGNLLFTTKTTFSGKILWQIFTTKCAKDAIDLNKFG